MGILHFLEFEEIFKPLGRDFEQISKKIKNPPKTFRFWSGDLNIMVAEKNLEFRGRAQF